MSGMILLFVTGLALWAVVGTLLAVASDGYRRVPTDPTLVS